MSNPTTADLNGHEALVEAIVTYIRKEIVFDEDLVLGEDDDIITQGLIDSMGIVRLVAHLQERSGIEQIRRSDLTLDNFRTAGRIARMMASYVPETSAVPA